MTLSPDFDAHKRNVGDVRRRGRVVHRPVLRARRGRFCGMAVRVQPSVAQSLWELKADEHHLRRSHTLESLFPGSL